MDKKEINIGTIGHVDHGKTTLTEAITKILEFNNNDLYNSIDSNIDRITINAKHIEYNFRGYSKNSNNYSRIGLIVTDSEDTNNLCSNILLASQMGISHLLIFVKNLPIDDIEKDIFQRTIHTLLDAYKYNKDTSSIMYGSSDNIIDKEGILSILESVNMIARENNLYECEPYIEPVLNDIHYPRNMVKSRKDNRNINQKIKTKYLGNNYLVRNHIKR